MTVDPNGSPSAETAGSTPLRREAQTGLTVAELAKFSAAAALLAMLADAAVAHAIAWENDPYWTYWITDTFLIATVIGLGTAWLGIGPGRGAVLILIQTAVLTIYYWSLSPVGFPSAPKWLDLEHTWLSGAPIHFGVYYLGYLGALWLWRRRGPQLAGHALRRIAVQTLLVAAMIVTLVGLAQALAFGEFQGITWYVVRLVVAVPILFLWQGLAGRDGPAAIGGTVVLTAALTAYSHFLGPIGIPGRPVRVFERASPGAPAHWLDYRDGVMVAMPITFIIVLAGFAVLLRTELRRWRPGGRTVAALGAGLVGLAGVGAAVAPRVGPGADHASVTASGAAAVETGALFSGTTRPGGGNLTLRAVQRNPRITPLPPHNALVLSAAVRHPDGRLYTIDADQPMVADPRGRFDTYGGVGLDVWQHGHSGIGDPRQPATHSQVAVFASGAVSRDGRQLAANVPIHVITMNDGEIQLCVGDPSLFAIPDLPDGHLRAIWTGADVSTQQAKGPRYLFGGVLLAALLALAAAGLRSRPSGQKHRGGHLNTTG